MLLLAQEQPSTPAPPREKATTSDIVVAAVVLIAIALVGGFVWMWMRKRLFSPESAASPGTMMEDLRKMRDEGQITAEEYDSVRKNMAARLARSGFGEEKAPAKGRASKD